MITPTRYAHNIGRSRRGHSDERVNIIHRRHGSMRPAPLPGKGLQQLDRPTGGCDRTIGVSPHATSFRPRSSTQNYDAPTQEGSSPYTTTIQKSRWMGGFLETTRGALPAGRSARIRKYFGTNQKQGFLRVWLGTGNYAVTRCRKVRSHTPKSR